MKHSEKFAPILILLNINMPIMNGFEFLNNYRGNFYGDSRYESVIICMFTSSADQVDVKKSLSYPFVKDYITKPVKPEVFENLYAKHFSESQ